MNASASSLDREDEVQSEIRKVRTFSRGARVVCAAIFGFGLVGGVVLLLIVLLGPISDTTLQLTTPQLKMWAFLVVGVLMGVGLASVYQLYRVFGNLAAGAIYTSENVRRLRHIGLLWLLWVVLGFLIPFASLALIEFGFRDALAPIKHQLVFPSLSQSLSSVVAAGLVLLVSWIMDVGLYAKDHADALQSDADLVI